MRRVWALVLEGAITALASRARLGLEVVVGVVGVLAAVGAHRALESVSFGLFDGRLVGAALVAWTAGRVTFARLPELRPSDRTLGLHPLRAAGWRHLGRTAVGVTVGLPPLLVIGAASGLVQAPQEGWQGVATLLSLGLGVRLWTLLAVLAARADQALGDEAVVRPVLVALAVVASGALLPLRLLPGTWSLVAQALPFAGLAHVPMLLWTGAVGGEGALAWLAAQAAWCVVIEGAARQALRR